MAISFTMFYTIRALFIYLFKATTKETLFGEVRETELIKSFL